MKSLKWILLICVLLFAFTGGAFGEEITLTFWHPWPSKWFEPRMGPVVDLFEYANPDIKIEIVQIPFPEFHMKLSIAGAAGKSPDMSFVNVTSSQSIMVPGYFQTIDDLVANSTVIDPSDYYRNFWKVGFCEGKQYCLPLNTDDRAMYYNKKLFEEIGVDVPPRNWEEFVEVAKKLTKGDTCGYGFRGGSGWDVALDELGTVLVQLDASLISPDGTRSQVKNPKVRQAFERLAQMFEENIVQGTALTDKAHEMVPLFSAGRIATFIENPGAPGELKEAGMEYGKDFGTAVVPYSADAHVGSCQGGWFIGMYKTGRHQEAAWKFMEFTQRPAITTFTTGELLPVRKSAMERFTVWSSKDYLAPFLETLPYAKPPYPIVPQLPGIFQMIREEFGEHVIGNQTFDEMLDRINNSVNQLLSG